MYIKKKYFQFFLIFFMCFFTQCKIYKFTDASINPNIKTIKVNQFSNTAPIQVSTLSASIEDKLTSKFLRESRLNFVTQNPDIEFNGTIIEYYIEPISISGTEVTAQNRLSIAIKVDFTNKIEENKNFSQIFRDGENFNANQDIAQVQNQLIEVILDRIVQNIFNKAFVNW
jgi:hypothetical protein